MEAMENQCYEVQMISNEKGRGLIAKRVIKEDEVILQENPLICSQFAWNSSPQYPYSACDHCMAPLDPAEKNVCRLTTLPDINLPFPECCEVKPELATECDMCSTKYCSPECKIEAFQRYHQTICVQSKEPADSHPMTVLINTWKRMHYPPETTSIMLVVKIVALVRQNPDLKQTFVQFCQKTVNEEEAIMHHLLKDKFEKHIDELRELVKNVINVDHVPEWFTPEGFRSLLALIGTNAQGIGTSSFARWVKNVGDLSLDEKQRTEIDNYIDTVYNKLDEVVGTFLNNEGSGLYPTQSSVNHSCTPNAIVEFPYSNSSLVLRALRDIGENEEIYISYINDCSLDRSRHSRQKILKEMYLFNCKCDKCVAEADDPDVTSESECEDEEMSE